MGGAVRGTALRCGWRMARLADSEKTIWALRSRIKELEEQLEAAQERLARYEEPGWINSVQAVVAARSALRLVVECEDALTEDGYLYLVEAAREVLGGSGSNPATRRRIEVEIAGDGSGVALPPLEDSVGVEPTPRIAGPELPGASPQDSSPARES